MCHICNFVRSLAKFGEYNFVLTPRCPECKSMIDIANIPVIGEVILCPDCKREFIVTWLYPITLDYDNQEALPYLSADIHIEINGGK